jgi:hypothetical protein
VSEPPADPEDWTDDQWLDWLAEQDAAAGDAPRRDDRPVPTPRSLPAELLGGAMRGLAEALYGPRKREVEIVSEAPGDPLDDDPLELHLDPDDPTESRAVLRPWRSHRRRPRSGSAGDGDGVVDG